jgi:hypothetical protein
MTKTERFCDRCQVKILLEDLYTFIPYSGSKYKGFDLCERCYKKLKKWLKEKDTCFKCGADVIGATCQGCQEIDGMCECNHMGE